MPSAEPADGKVAVHLNTLQYVLGIEIPLRKHAKGWSAAGHTKALEFLKLSLKLHAGRLGRGLTMRNRQHQEVRMQAQSKTGGDQLAQHVQAL